MRRSALLMHVNCALHRYVIKQDYTKYMETTGVVLTCKKFLNWLQQLLKSPVWFVLHIDGKHKLHYGVRNRCAGMLPNAR